MKKILLLLLTILSLQLRAQNLFPVKLDRCSTSAFCLDCGDTKAGYNQDGFLKMQVKLNASLNLQGIQGAVKFQVLIDSSGNACVLSHTDPSKHPITLAIVNALNVFDKWVPAITKHKKEANTSITIVFAIKDNQLDGKIERVAIKAFEKTFNKPNGPEIYNKDYTYTNENLKKYKITVWNSGNSNLPDNLNDHVTIDREGLIWLTIGQGLVTFDGKNFKRNEQDIVDKGKYFAYYALATDNENTKWIYAKNNIYSFDNHKWKKYDAAEIGIDGAYRILNQPKTGELFFCSDEGLTILKDGKWSNLNSDKIKDLPSNRVAFAQRDAKKRLWIGTYSGSIMIDEKGRATNFERTNTVLKGKCITSMDEDEKGNIYFTLYEFNRKEKGKVNNDEGIAIRFTDGTFKQLTTSNSGLPFNHATCVRYDQKEKIIWIATDRAGLVRYDLKGGWENYHNENSDIPTSYISAMTFDANGNLFLATRQGLVKIERK